MGYSEARVDEIAEHYIMEEMVEECEHAKDPIVVSICQQWKEGKNISQKQIRCLARWIAASEDEYK